MANPASRDQFAAVKGVDTPRGVSRNHMTRLVPTLAAAALLVAGSAVNAAAQLIAAKDGPIVYGHHHIAASDIPAQLKFFADTLGGTKITFGPQNIDVVKFPNVFIFFRNQKPTGGTKGTTVNHIGFSVPNLRQTLDRVKAGGYAVITRTEVAPTQQVIDDIAPVNANTSIAFVMGPDEVKVELLENKQQTTPIALHHVHFFGPQNNEMREWYVKVFGAKARDAASEDERGHPVGIGSISAERHGTRLS